MTTSAVTRLHDNIDAVRREAFADGFASAMRLVREFASQPPAGDAVEETVSVAAVLPAAGAALPRRRPRRGTNARLIEALLQSIAPRAARPTEIRNVLRQQMGVAIAFTSIRHALGQLAARRVAEQVAHSKSWRYLSEGAASRRP